METINARNLKAELKDYLDLAATEPIRINRRSGEALILMREDLYASMQNEILSLQRRLLGMSQALEGQGSNVEPSEAAGRLRSRARAKKGVAP
jgi:PHD/YefM family antitoxin component YafN of YafNO toxin-antitoxin module